MTLLSASDIEGALLPFRVGRRLLLENLTDQILHTREIAKPFLLFSRLFVRLKSADSILEKINRKRIAIQNTNELPEKVPDILGVRIIVESANELLAIERFLKTQFQAVTPISQPPGASEFGARGIECSLRYHVDGAVYPFELQARTFLQHYWASRSFHLLHKKAREAVLTYQDALKELSAALEQAESIAEDLDERQPSPGDDGPCNWSAGPLRSRIHLVVVEPGERLADHVIQLMTGDDLKDHASLVSKKLELYAANPGSAIVECSCLNFSSFMLNEPHVQVPVNRLDRLAL